MSYVLSMREAFAAELAAIERRITAESDRIVLTLAVIANAVGDPTAEKAEAIARSGQELRDASLVADADLVTLTAREAPVADDLRLVLTLIQVAHHEALIANQFDLINQQLTAIDPDVYDRQGTAEQLFTMASLAGDQLQHALTAFIDRDVAAAQMIDREDDAIDRLNRRIFDATLNLDAEQAERELALRYVLIARSLERIGDNAVDIAEQVAFLVTAELREFTDASRPKPRRD